MTKVIKILIGSLLLSGMLTAASVAQPLNLGASTAAFWQDKGKDKEKPVERPKKDEQREKPRDEKKDDKRKKPDE